MKLKHLYLPWLLLALTACGGGNNTSGVSGSRDTTGDNTGALSVMITDDMTTQYSKVWVTVLKVTTTDSSAQQHILYEDATGQVFNLTELHGVATLLSTQNLPADTYNNFEITLANDISLVDKQGQTIQATFNSTGDPEVIQIQGSVTITAGGIANMGVDFDLKRFTYDPTTGLVTPVLLYLDNHQLQQISFNHAEVEGRVTEITDAQTFVLENRYGSTITVTLQATATIYNEYTGTIGGDTSALTIGQVVKVFGSYDAATMTLNAVSAKIYNDNSPSGSPASTEVKGVITSFDGTTLVLDVRDADFIPGSTVLEISNVANAVFTKGSLDTLAAGQWIEVKGTWEDPVFTAMVVEIEGGIPCWDDGHHFDDDSNDLNGDNHTFGYVELKGLVTGVNGTVLTLNLTQANNLVGQTTGPLDIDINNAWYKDGSVDCLTEGAYVEVKGTNDTSGGGVVAFTIEIKSPCGSSSNNDPTSGPVNYVEVGGLITAVDGDTITISVIHSEYFVPASNEVQVVVTNAWFEHGTQLMLAQNRYVEAKGGWDGSQLSAYKIEFE